MHPHYRPWLRATLVGFVGRTAATFLGTLLALIVFALMSYASLRWEMSKQLEAIKTKKAVK